MRRHGLDPGSLVAGLFFLGLSGIFLASGLSGEEILALEVLIPTVVAGLGVVGLAMMLRRG